MRGWLVAGLALSLVACDRPRAASGLDADPFAVRTEGQLAAQISAARNDAAASDRRVLLDFIADWCTDCREVVRLSHLPPAREVIEERYIVVYVEVGRFDRHRALIAEHHVDRIATLVVLDPDSGDPVARTTLEPITGGERGLTAEDLARWLRDPS
ncbi:MAG: thioredoxin family protein [Sandaracinaceae bacterium]